MRSVGLRKRGHSSLQSLVSRGSDKLTLLPARDSLSVQRRAKRVPEEPLWLFEAMTPLGFPVRTTWRYWSLIEKKHPEITDQHIAIQECLRSPQFVRQSKQDSSVYLFYRMRGPYHLCAVVKRSHDAGFIVTCYVTDKIKEGAIIWPTSA